MFGSLLAYAGLLYIKYWGDGQCSTTSERNIVTVKPLTDRTNSPFKEIKKKQNLEVVLKKMNFRFLVLFMVLFSLFNLIYWTMVFSP